MRTTIDAAGRVVVPKAARDAMGLVAGQEIDIVFTDGRIEIEIPPVEVALEVADGLPRLSAAADLPALTDEQIRSALEATRR